MKIISVVGARPNFMKIAPFIKEIERFNKTAHNKIQHNLVHTGQHYDDNMNKIFFRSLNIPEADINLGVGSGSHAEQVGYTMIKFEKILQQIKPDWVIVVGDVNATLACSVTAKKELVKVCHIEAGLRSNDLTMPEEINRLVTDRLSDLLLTPDHISIENLKKEGVPDKRIKFVGNIMIDTLETNYKKAAALDIKQIIRKNLYKSTPAQSISVSTNNDFALITLHRPSNVDKKEIFEPIVNFLTEEVSTDMQIFWPVHPRAIKQLIQFGIWEKLVQNSNIFLLNPLGYHEMLQLNMNARIILTDSGGLQEESTVLGTPCLTLRWNTERPVTLREYGGASVLVGNNIERIVKEYHDTLELPRKPKYPELWDGKTAGRCLRAILDYK